MTGPPPPPRPDAGGDGSEPPDVAAADAAAVRPRPSRLRTVFYAGSAALLAIAVLFAELPYVRYLPGSPAELTPLIELDGVDTNAIDGTTSLLTVFLDEVTPAELFSAWRDPTQGLNPASAIAPFGGLTPAFYAAQRESFAQQFEVAVAAGAEAAGYDVEVRTATVVDGVLPGSPSDGRLVAGDRILAVDGEPIASASALQGITRRGRVGDVLSLTVSHGDGDERAVDITLDVIDGSGRPGLGIGVADLVDEVVLPFEASLGDTRIGGPSAGLMTSVTTYDLLSEEDLIRGRDVVGTGTMAPDGTVGGVGGVGAKVRSAVEVGADVMLVPAGQLEDALAADPPDSLELLPVGSLTEALEALRR